MELTYSLGMDIVKVVGSITIILKRSQLRDIYMCPIPGHQSLLKALLSWACLLADR